MSDAQPSPLLTSPLFTSTTIISSFPVAYSVLSLLFIDSLCSVTSTLFQRHDSDLARTRVHAAAADARSRTARRTHRQRTIVTAHQPARHLLLHSYDNTVG